MKFDKTEAKRLAEQAWASNPDLRREFLSKEDFIAYRLAVAAGHARTYGGSASGTPGTAGGRGQAS